MVDTVWDNSIFQGIVETAITIVCSTELNFGVCRGFVNSLAPIIIENVRELTLQPGYMCSKILPLCGQDFYQTLDHEDFTRKMLADKPPAIADDNFVNALYETISQDPLRNERKTIKIVQFTDIHLDLKYVSGADKICSYVICCREVNGFPLDKSRQAGPLGSYGCDVPIDTLTTMGEFINAEVKPDIIFWTGDIVPHD